MEFIFMILVGRCCDHVWLVCIIQHKKLIIRIRYMYDIRKWREVTG